MPGALDSFLSKLDQAGAGYRRDPVAWTQDRLGEELWSKQREVAASVAKHRRTAVHSCHGVGKTRIASRIAAWWIDTHPVGEAIVVSTAPTFAQVRAALWQEINNAHAKGGLPGVCNQTEWWSDGVLLGFGRTPQHYDPTAFQGIHRRYVLVIIDEACGIPKPLWTAVQALATNDDSRILAIGNPDDATSFFAEVCAPGSAWNIVHIDAFDSPNFTGEEISDSLADILVGKNFVEEMRQDVGEDSPIWLSKIRGIFPTDADDAVVRYSSVSRCQQAQDHEPEELGLVELGVDVGGGTDKTVIWARRGPVAYKMWARSTPEPDDAIALVLHAIHEMDASACKIDAIGIGWGIAGALEEKRKAGEHQCRIVRVNVGEKATDTKRFPKLRDELWWDVGRKLTESGAWDLSGLELSTVSQLCSPKYGIDSNGRVKVEAKDETRKRLGRSPDEADALLLAFWTGGARRRRRMVHAGP